VSESLERALAGLGDAVSTLAGRSYAAIAHLLRPVDPHRTGAETGPAPQSPPDRNPRSPHEGANQ